MYVYSDAIGEVLMWLKRLSAGTLVSRSTVKRHMNEALKEIYQQAIVASPDFYSVKTTNFASTALLAYPASYRSTLLVECTDSDCVAGFARPVGTREYTIYSNSSTSGPSNTDPICLIGGSGIKINPARSGYHYYLMTIGDVTDETTDLETIIPWLWIEPLILKTMELARLRSGAQSENPTGIEKGLKLVDLAHQSLKASFKPLNLFNQPVPEPAGLQS